MRHYLYICLSILLVGCSNNIYDLSTIRNEHYTNQNKIITTQINKIAKLTNDSTILSFSLLNNECTPKDIVKSILVSINKTSKQKIVALSTKAKLITPNTYSNILEVKKQTNTSKRRNLSFNIKPILLTISVLLFGGGVAFLIYYKKDQLVGALFAIVALWFVLYTNRII